MLSQHNQPCDCAICDQIHFNRETRRKKRNEPAPPSPMYGEIDKLKANNKALAAENEELKELNTKYLAEIRALHEKLEEQVMSCNEAWMQATGGNYPSHTAKIIEALRQEIHDLESVRAENAELRGINQSLSVNYVKYKDMKGALEFFARLKQDMLIVDINRIANAVLHNTIEEPI